MARIKDLDKKDKILIDMIQKEPEITQSELAKILKLSQPSIGNRLKKLKDLGFVAHRIGIDLHKAGLFMIEADVNAKDTVKVIEMFKECPYFIDGIVESGSINLVMLFAGEDLATLESIIEHRLRNNPHIIKIQTNVITSSTSRLIYPLRLVISKKQKPVCVNTCECNKCDLLSIGRCKGCPYTQYYKGTLWERV